MKPDQKPNDGRRRRKAAKDANPAILKGKFFHSVEDGCVKWQGRILGSPSPGYYLVQLFEWLMGGPSNQQIIPFEKMRDWYFYDSSEELKYSWEHGSASRFRRALEEKAARECELKFGKPDKKLPLPNKRD
jgi:hypothetical protein